MNRSTLFDTYAFLFSRKKFYRFNRALFQISLRGMGILNYKDSTASGERRFLEDTLAGAPRPVVFDIGANEGSYSAAILSISPNADVYAFEPHPATFQRLSSRFSSARNVTVVNAACGKSKGSAALFDYSGSQGSAHASLHSGVIETIHHGKSDQHLVNIVDVDSFVAEHGIANIDLLKIDTEGNELEVLKGAEKSIRDHRVQAIQFEFGAMNIVSRVFLRDFYDALPGYRLHRLVRDGMIPIPYSPLWCELFEYQNLVALPMTKN